VRHQLILIRYGMNVLRKHAANVYNLLLMFVMKKALRGDANTVLAVVGRTHKQTNRQGRLQYTVQLSMQCNCICLALKLSLHYL